MTEQPDLPSLSLEGIAHRCAHESALFFARRAHDPRYCYELFRRAIQERDQRAWQLVYAQYQPLIVSWIERHPTFASSGEETQYYVNRAFEKMWLALTPARFARFPELKALLRYLQMCVHSAILDRLRAADDAALHADLDDLPAAAGDPAPTVEEQALARAQRQDLWQHVNALLHTDKERRVVYGSFVLALKPNQLCAMYPHTFRDVDEVYTVKQNVLARLRRDAGLRRFLDPDA